MESVKKWERPWGWYINVKEEKESFKIKHICVYPGKRLSLQSHFKRSEHWVIVKGTAKVTVGKDELILHKNQNVVKVAVKEKLSNDIFLNALDFFRVKTNSTYNLYHHIGIYAFTNKALIRYVSLKRTKLELERKLEQLRALENKMSIHVGYIKSSPLSVDTEEDLIEVKNLMEKNEKN